MTAPGWVTGWGPPEPAGSSWRARAVLVVVGAVAGAVLAVPAGWLWVQLADPPSGMLDSSRQVLFGEIEADQVVGATWWFLVVGMAFGVVTGVALSWRGYRHGIATVIAVLALSTTGSFVSYVVGHEVFGADVAQQLAAAETGDRITADVRLTSDIAYLGWPMGGLLGVLVGVVSWPKSAISPRDRPLVE